MVVISLIIPSKLSLKYFSSDFAVALSLVNTITVGGFLDLNFDWFLTFVYSYESLFLSKEGYLGNVVKLSVNLKNKMTYPLARNFSWKIIYFIMGNTFLWRVMIPDTNAFWKTKISVTY